MAEEIELVEVKLQIPKAIKDFLISMRENVEEYLVAAIVNDLACSIEGEQWNPREFIGAFGLIPVFKKWDCLESYFPDEAKQEAEKEQAAQ